MVGRWKHLPRSKFVCLTAVEPKRTSFGGQRIASDAVSVAENSWLFEGKYWQTAVQLGG